MVCIRGVFGFDVHAIQTTLCVTDAAGVQTGFIQLTSAFRAGFFASVIVFIFGMRQMPLLLRNASIWSCFLFAWHCPLQPVVPCLARYV